MNRLVQRYLAGYAQPESGIPTAHAGEHECVLVIPCYDENISFLSTVLPPDAHDLLVIVVVNAPDNAPEDARTRTLNLLKDLRGHTSLPAATIPYARGRNVHLQVIDRVSDERAIPHRQGVGLARKIGADCALALMAAEKVQRKWIYATDADVCLGEGYLNHPMPTSGTALFPFRHVSPDPDMARSAELYELHLRYYVNRLTNAGSPYAFHTLGSTTAIHAQAYAKVRGYPRRNAGEDFYLLNKLAKVDGVYPLSATTPPPNDIIINARHSHRVPFGTGPALAKMPPQADDYTSYSPSSFLLLGEVFDNINRTCTGQPWEASVETNTVLIDLGFFAALEQAQRQHQRPDTLGHALHVWFDGFRTLRFIHECRRFHPDRPLLDSLGSILQVDQQANMLDPTAPRRQYLAQLRAMERRANTTDLASAGLGIGLDAGLGARDGRLVGKRTGSASPGL